jgi:hypothetical protein
MLYWPHGLFSHGLTWVVALTGPKGPFRRLAPFKVSGTTAAARTHILWVHQTCKFWGSATAAASQEAHCERPAQETLGSSQTVSVASRWCF